MVKHISSIVALATAAFAQNTPAKPETTAPSFHVDIVGKGKPMILIPGFASSGHTWDSTVARYKDRFECHVLTLAGFAGQPATNATPFLENVRNDLAAYIRKNKMDKPVIVGHSLGGFMALWLAEKEPDLVGPLVIVDSLPFLPAATQPGATSDSVKPFAENIRKIFSGPPTPDTDKMTETQVRAMVTKQEDYEMILAWGKKSDHITEGNAIYEMMTTDLRNDLDKIKSTAIVIGTWIAYKQYGVTRDGVERNFRTQYAKLANFDFILEDNARHFVMLDDPDAFFAAMDAFLLGTK